jgi:hypothetical protein
MTDRLQADVESEASNVVLMARRVLDALGENARGPSCADDNVMVTVRVVDRDVNLFEARVCSPRSTGSLRLRLSSDADTGRRTSNRARAPAGLCRRAGWGRSVTTSLRRLPALGPEHAITVRSPHVSATSSGKSTT